MSAACLAADAPRRWRRRGLDATQKNRDRLNLSSSGSVPQWSGPLTPSRDYCELRSVSGKNRALASAHRGGRSPFRAGAPGS